MLYDDAMDDPLFILQEFAVIRNTLHYFLFLESIGRSLPPPSGQMSSRSFAA